MASVGIQDPSVMALAVRDTRSAAQKFGGKLGAGIAKTFGGGSKKQAEYSRAVGNLAESLHSKAVPKLKEFAKEKGKQLLQAGIAKARSYVGLKRGGRVYRKMCKGGKCGKKKMVSFKSKGRVIRFATGGKVRHAPGRF
jgi:hypothetical protein